MINFCSAEDSLVKNNATPYSLTVLLVSVWLSIKLTNNFEVEKGHLEKWENYMIRYQIFTSKKLWLYTKIKAGLSAPVAYVV